MEKFFFSGTACSFTKERLPHRCFVPEHFRIFPNNFFEKHNHTAATELFFNHFHILTTVVSKSNHSEMFLEIGCSWTQKDNL